MIILQKSGKIPGVGLVHAPICLLPSPFSDAQFKQAIELAPLFNELIDAVSLDHVFLQETLSRFWFQSFTTWSYFPEDQIINVMNWHMDRLILKHCLATCSYTGQGKQIISRQDFLIFILWS